MTEKDWEKLLRIKTTGRDDSRSDTYRYPYEPTSYEVLNKLANTGIIGKNNTLLDYGCGKGRVSLFMAYQTKCHSIGIEYDNRIFERAIANKESSISGGRVTFINEDALKYNIEIFNCVLANIMDNFYNNPREMYMIFYYPSDEYLMCLSQEYDVSLYDEIDCRDISFGEARRERMVVYRIGENTEV